MVVNVSTTSQKPKKVALEYEDFIAMVNNRVKSLSFDYCMNHKVMELPNKIKKQFENQVAKEIEAKFKIKGSRYGHINKADAETQTKFSSLKEQIEEIKFTGSDGITYVCTILCKKAVTEKATK